MPLQNTQNQTEPLFLPSLPHPDPPSKRSEVVEAKKETSSIDKLKEKKFKEYEKAVQKEEEQFIEEFVATKRAMARIMG